MNRYGYRFDADEREQGIAALIQDGDITKEAFFPELLKFLEREDIEGSFRFIEKLPDGEKYAHEDEYVFNALWSAYLRENGHKDFLTHLKVVPPYCLAYSDIDAIFIPKNIDGIQFNAFLGCPNVESIVVEEGNPHYDSRNDCNMIVMHRIHRVVVTCKNSTFDPSIQDLGRRAFDQFDETSPCIHEYGNLLYIGTEENPFLALLRPKSKDIAECSIHPDCKFFKDAAFFGCTSLKEIVVPEGITALPYQVFANCKSLERVILPDSLRDLGYNAFENSPNLYELRVPEGVIALGEDAFDGSFIRVVCLPKSITYIDESALGYSCISDVIYDGTFDEYQDIENDLEWLGLAFIHIVTSDGVHYPKHGLYYGELDKKAEAEYRAELEARRKR